CGHPRQGLPGRRVDAIESLAGRGVDVPPPYESLCAELERLGALMPRDRLRLRAHGWPFLLEPWTDRRAGADDLTDLASSNELRGAAGKAVAALAPAPLEPGLDREAQLPQGKEVETESTTLLSPDSTS